MNRILSSKQFCVRSKKNCCFKYYMLSNTKVFGQFIFTYIILSILSIKPCEKKMNAALHTIQKVFDMIFNILFCDRN